MGEFILPAHPTHADLSQSLLQFAFNLAEHFELFCDLTHANLDHFRWVFGFRSDILRDKLHQRLYDVFVGLIFTDRWLHIDLVDSLLETSVKIEHFAHVILIYLSLFLQFLQKLAFFPFRIHGTELFTNLVVRKQQVFDRIDCVLFFSMDLAL